MSKMSESEVVKVLWKREAPEWAMTENNVPDYLHSIDALRPVLAKLTPEEWRWMDEYMAVRYAFGRAQFMQAMLTLDPLILAQAVAESVVACRKEAL